MKIIDLLDTLNPDRSVQIFVFGSGFEIADYDSIRNVQLKFALEDVVGLDLNLNAGGYEIYINY